MKATSCTDWFYFYTLNKICICILQSVITCDLPDFKFTKNTIPRVFNFDFSETSKRFLSFNFGESGRLGRRLGFKKWTIKLLFPRNHILVPVVIWLLQYFMIDDSFLWVLSVKVHFFWKACLNHLCVFVNNQIKLTKQT